MRTSNLHRFTAGVLSCLLVIAFSQSARATWSVVITDQTTGEIGIGQATCLNNRNLRAGTTAIRVQKGAGVVQNSGDPDGSRRLVMYQGLIDGDSPEMILSDLSNIGGHNTRQYGICDTLGSAVSFSGGGGRKWNGGLSGTTGNLAYAIQGNTLAGPCIVPAMVTAIEDSINHDIPQKIMAAMQAARMMGGDGRCSCSKGPDKCGCPPMATFDKSAHVGFILVSRPGDTDTPLCNVNGCAAGNYFMTFDITLGDDSTLDPIIQLQALFDDWRAGLRGFPDAIQSVVTIDPDTSTATTDDYLMTIELKDWRPAGAVASVVTVEHENSGRISIIGTPLDTGGGIYTVALTDVTSGTERFRVTADGVILAPFAELTVGDVDGDGYDVPQDCDDNDAAVNPGAVEICDDGVDNDCDGLADEVDPDCGGGPVCGLKSDACSVNADCCSGKCRRGKCVGGPTTTNMFYGPLLLSDSLFATNSASPLGCTIPAKLFN